MASGDSNLFFSRDTKVFLVQGSNIWEIPVLNGYTFTQATNSSTITLQEMSDASGTSRRGQIQFNDSLSPAEWGFDSYMRPTLVTGSPDKHFAVEEALWANFVGQNAYTSGTTSWSVGVTRDADKLDFDFDDSNKTFLGTFDLYFVYGANKVTGSLNYTDTEVTTIYKMSSCAVNEATINFDIDGIATISWSGFGKTIAEVAAWDGSSAIQTGITQTTNLVRNRLTALTANSSVSGTSVDYDITLTGGSITLSNNLTYLTPETLGIVNVPLEHVSGTRSVTGNFTCYLDEVTDGSIDLYEDLLGATTVVTNAFALDFYIGGKDTDDNPVAPGVQFKMGQCNLEVPSITNDDVIGLEVNFTALPATISGTDEITRIRYIGVE